MPAEWAPHERTIMCWPARESMWQEHFAQAQADHAEVANAIAAFEPVLMAADPRHAAEARRLLRRRTSRSWRSRSTTRGRATPARSSSLDEDGERAGVQLRLQRLGREVPALRRRRALRARRVLEALGEAARDATHFVLEGGSIAVDGEGTLITTEQCLFEEHRNPQLAREEIEAELRAQLGAERVVWLGLGLVEDDDTDGHVDNICAFVAPGKVVLQTVTDEANPNYEHCRENLRRLRAAGLEVVELPWLPYVAGRGAGRSSCRTRTSTSATAG